MTRMDATEYPGARDSGAILFPVSDYDLAATLDSGQAFRWRAVDDAWEGILAGNFFRLRQTTDGISAELLGSAASQHGPRTTHSEQLRDYLQLDVDLAAVIATFPEDAPMRAAVAACRGLRLLRQEPWECLVSFICSSTKQIVQIRQIIARLCERFGEPIPVAAEVRRLHSNAERGAQKAKGKSEPPDVGSDRAFAFPSASRLAGVSETELRACKMGFRAPYVLAAAQTVASGGLDLARLHLLSTDEARVKLMELPGVGRKIADCVLLFAFGKQDAFPVDVWVRRALTELYFPRRRPTPQRLERFANTHFEPNAGFAQQYLFHYVRTLRPKE